jgi:hypothetical protein
MQTNVPSLSVIAKDRQQEAALQSYIENVRIVD